MSTETIRVMIADDHPMIISGVARLVEDSNMKVVGTATKAKDVCRILKKAKPDVLVLDIKFGHDPGQYHGLDIISDVVQMNGTVKIVVMSQYTADEIIKSAYQLGAHSFIPKDLLESKYIIKAIKLASIGKHYFLPAIQERLALMHTRTGNNLLEKKEKRILSMLCHGKSANDIARELEISNKYVYKLLTSVKKKLGIQNDILLTHYCIARGIVPIRDSQ